MPCSQSWQRREWVVCFVFESEPVVFLNVLGGSERVEPQISQIGTDYFRAWGN
jgi:hypothetical protein